MAAGRTSHPGESPLPTRRLALLALAFAGAALRPVRAQTATLPQPASLAEELSAALRQGKPLVVMASLNGCGFCNLVRNDYLAPLRRDSGQPTVQLDMGSSQVVLDFGGTRTSHAELLRAWKIDVAPTVLFFGAGGREVAMRLAGASIPDYYGAYLDERLRTARQNLR